MVKEGTRLDLSSARTVKELLARHGLRARHGLGQNFLVDQRALDRIVDAVDPQPGALVLEIGPGLGVLTRAVAERGARVLAVEIDPGMVSVLGETLTGLDQVEVVHGDVMEADLPGLLSARLGPGERARVAANLPYYITSPVLFRLLEHDLPLSRIVVMVQREVAVRMVANPGGKDYGALSVAVQFYTRPSLVTTVSRGAFWPPPEVDSAVVAMEVYEQPPVDAPRRDLFRVVKAAFGQRRKTLLNALSAGLDLPKDRLEPALREAGVDPGRRGETLSLPEFAAVARAIFP